MIQLQIIIKLYSILSLTEEIVLNMTKFRANQNF